MGSMSRRSGATSHSAASIPRRASPVNVVHANPAQFRPAPSPATGIPLNPVRPHDFTSQDTPSFNFMHGACWAAASGDANNDFVGNLSKDADRMSSWENCREHFRDIFTLSCILAFLNPIWLMVHLGQDPTVLYWFGPWSRAAVFLPLIFIFGHIVHWKMRRPFKPVILLCLFVPSVYLLVVSNLTMTSALNKADQLFSTDCDSLYGKRQLERSWMLARDLYLKCLEDTVRLAPASRNLTFSKAARLYRFQDCTEYKDDLRHQVDWKYLWYLEEEDACAGWCTKSHPIWTFKEVRDSCSVATAQVFDDKVAKRSRQVVLYSLGLLVFTSISLVSMGPILRARGYDW